MEYFLYLVYPAMLKFKTYPYLVEPDYKKLFAMCQRAIDVTPLCLPEVEVQKCHRC